MLQGVCKICIFCICKFQNAYAFLHKVHFVFLGQSKNEPYQKPSGNFVPKPKKTNLSRCDKDVKALDQGTLPGIFGHAVEGKRLPFQSLIL